MVWKLDITSLKLDYNALFMNLKNFFLVQIYFIRNIPLWAQVCELIRSL